MSNEKIARVIQVLAHKTASGAVAWQLTSEDGVYEAAYPTYSIRLYLMDGRRGKDVVVEVINSEGQSIELATDEHIVDRVPESYKLMYEMYDSVRRQASGVDKVLDEILRDLQSSESLRRS